MRHVFIIGSKGIPACYGGFETFVERLTQKRKNKDIQYYVSCASNNNDEFEYNQVKCFNVNVPSIGSAKAVVYDLQSLQRCIEIIKNNNLKDCIVYVLACRVGPFIWYFKKRLKKIGAKLFVNPDGHEWKRSKWNAAIRWYWKYSENLTVKHVDLLVCDSKGIESYIRNEYREYRPRTTFISYGADVEPSIVNENPKDLDDWYLKHGLRRNEYYLVVGRFVPENNYETMIREFMLCKSKRDLAIITDVEKNAFYERLRRFTGFENDKRIKFVGTVYEQSLLTKIRENSFAYLHGHEVGGTNPSLLEALASTRINILLDVVFNKEVGLDSALYFNKEKNSLAGVIEHVEEMDEDRITGYSNKARERILRNYSWDKIVKDYEDLFLSPW
jgi:rhamnosyltransferase